MMYERCAGADVHKDTVVVCVLRGPAGGGVESETRTFGTKTADLLELADWLKRGDVTHVAMESTGVYWKPVMNVLEGEFEVWLVNAQHVKAVPGRKTDVKDCVWLAELMRNGLLRRSMVPDHDTRMLREVVRYRRRLLQEKAHEANRLQKVLEDANVKLGSVATDVLGTSCRKMLRAIVAGERDGAKLADLALGKLRNKHDDLIKALTGRIRKQHGVLIRELLDHVEYLERTIDRLTLQVEEELRPFEEAICRLDEIVGVDRRTIQDVLAEIGTDMSRYPDASHLASWAGLCPGNNESGGKRLSGRTRKGSPWLKAALVQAAWGAVRNKKSYFNAQFRRLRHRGTKKAIVAVAHSLLVVIYHMLSEGTRYVDLGEDYFRKRDKDRAKARAVSQLQALGFKVTLEASA